MFDFGKANDAQKDAIQTVDGPLLITAGPGTGKTYTLVQRAIYMIEERGIRPEQIMIVTFTEKAAKELITRVTNELGKRGLSVNVNDMYIGTFHSICLRFLKDHLEYTTLRKNYKVLDSFDQYYLVFSSIYSFRQIENFELAITESGNWKQAKQICSYCNSLSEELVSPDLLKEDDDPGVIALGKILELYRKILDENNAMDFSSIQVKAYEMLKENPDVLNEIRQNITHIMVDEYQDTNYIQEQLVFLLSGENKNICVVGDDDQGLYRFRGATIRNILEYPSKFDKKTCKIVPLVINYRSNKDIIDFYNKWMETTSGSRFKFSWDKYRYPKKIVAGNSIKVNTPTVVKLSSEDDYEEWYERVFEFINNSKNNGYISDYNQIAFLFSSVKSDQATGLADYLETNGIKVYSPRSDMFFKREEIQLAIGCIISMFPQYLADLEQGNCKYLSDDHVAYYIGCVKKVSKVLALEENQELRKWMKNKYKVHMNLQNSTDYAFTGLIYQLFQFNPFARILDTDISGGVVDVRPVRNLAKFTQIVGKYEYLYNISVLTPNRYVDNTNKLFNLYLRLLFDGGITEYEDDSEYAPSGCVSFMTIHQSKGMEFPIVIVDSLGNKPRNNNNVLMELVEEKYFSRPPFEPRDQIKFFDFWRLYYTAFSRAQDLLVLTCNETSGTPSLYFKDTYSELLSCSDSEFDISALTFNVVKDVNLKTSFSFTSHILLYETCSRQYKFYKELEFMPVRGGAVLFGTLVHQTIEDIHKAAIRGEESIITEENVSQWFDTNYDSLSKTKHTYLAQPQKDAALRQILRYVDNQNGKWDRIKEAEVDVSLVEADYIIDGTIDLIRGESDSVEIVDFKSEKKPDLFVERDKLERYRRQLHLYAYLIEKRTGQKVSKMHLYYTGEDSGVPTISFPYTQTAIEGTVAAFDETAHKILNKEYTKCTNDPRVCQNCDFRFYCGNK